MFIIDFNLSSFELDDTAVKHCCTLIKLADNYF